jgi:asparagine synthase (glutamine-hydrolysing)
MAVDALGFLPSLVLVKVDRAAMAASLETRAPLLDHRVFELAARFPLPWVRGKAVLRRVLHRHVPRALVERPKMGFDVPLDAWLRGRLRGWADDLLAPGRLARDAFFEPAPVAALWSEHRRGARDHGARLWPVLMFQSWLDAERGRERTPSASPAVALAAAG